MQKFPFSSIDWWWWLIEFCCLTSTEARRPIRDGDEWECGTEEWNLETGANPENQSCRGPPPEQQDGTKGCYGSVRPALRSDHSDHNTTQLLSQLLCGTVKKTMSVAPPLGNNWSKRNQTLSLSIVQHHLPALDLFWASFFVRVQLTSLLLISPGLWIFIHS